MIQHENGMPCGDLAIDSEKREQGQIGFASWIPLLTATALMILLCRIGGHFLQLSLDKITPTPVFGFITLYCFTWLMCIILLLLIPHRLSPIATTAFILVSALISRLLFLLQMTSETVSPFGPVTGYPPNFIVFFLTYIVPAIQVSVSLTILSILFDMGVLCLIILLLSNRSLNLRWSLLYAFNPVILYSIAGGGYFDAISIFFLLAALLFYDRKKWVWMFVSAGIAVQSQPVTIITIPFLLRGDNWKYTWITVVVILAQFLPVFYTDGVFSSFGFMGFGDKNSIKGPIYSIFQKTLGGPPSASFISMVILGAILFFGYWHLHPQRNGYHLNDPISGCFFALGAWVVISPTIHYGSFAWVVPFLALRPTVSWMFLCLTIGLYFPGYGVSDDSGSGYLPLSAQLFIWLPFYGMLLHDVYLARLRAKSPVEVTLPESISVVIPTLNEAAAITACIQSVLKDTAVTEVIVVDSGSSDGTDHLAENTGAQVIHYKANCKTGVGRGGQILAGIKASTKDVVALVHADTRVTYPVFGNILSLLRKQPLIVGGAVGSLFNSNGWRFRVLEFANDLRMACMGISFGDQVQFFRRKPVVDNDLFPNIPLMEDVEFSIRLHRMGRQTYLFGNAMVSTRKWKAKGFGHAFTVIRLVATYLWQRLWGTPDTADMYLKYYGKNARLKS